MKILPKKLIIFTYLLLPSLAIISVLTIAGNTSDAVRLGFLSLPGLWLMYQVIQKPVLSWKVVTFSWWGIFCADALIRSTSWFVFNSDTDAHFIIQAIANTTSQESTEFLQFYGAYIGIALLIFIFTLVLYFYVLLKIPTQLLPQNKEFKYVFIGLSILALSSYALRPSRAQLPVLYWASYYNKIQTFKNKINERSSFLYE